MKNNEPEIIKLTFPTNAAYVSAARLTTSSIANRMGFNINDIEDIKTAVSEGCIFFIQKVQPISKNEFTVAFFLEPEILKVILSLPTTFSPSDIVDDISILMIKSLVDNFEITSKDDFLILSMTKIYKENTLKF
jgi:serine/threonine-protein kinase RsbW